MIFKIVKLLIILVFSAAILGCTKDPFSIKPDSLHKKIVYLYENYNNKTSRIGVVDENGKFKGILKFFDVIPYHVEVSNDGNLILYSKYDSDIEYTVINFYDVGKEKNISSIKFRPFPLDNFTEDYSSFGFSFDNSKICFQVVSAAGSSYTTIVMDLEGNIIDTDKWRMMNIKNQHSPIWDKFSDILYFVSEVDGKRYIYSHDFTTNIITPITDNIDDILGIKYIDIVNNTTLIAIDGGFRLKFHKISLNDNSILEIYSDLPSTIIKGISEDWKNWLMTISSDADVYPYSLKNTAIYNLPSKQIKQLTFASKNTGQLFKALAWIK